jgi:cytoskeletal protein RodZ
MWPILIIGLLLIVALGALALIIWGVVSAIKAFIKNSPEGKLKSAEEAAEAAAEAAETAAEAYNNLSDAFDSLLDKYSNLEDLTRGTQEWKNAVKDVNKEVLDLIETYPELAAFVTKDAEGVLRIDVESDEV